MSDDAPVLLVHDGPVSTLSVNRPKALNALNPEVLEALSARLDEVTARGETRCLILTGAGEKAFVAGADIAAMQAMTREQAAGFASLGQRIFERLGALSVPVIAAVNGFALGGGCELALACDFIYASSKARFGQPEVNLGVIPGFGGTQRLARRVGIAMARELIYTGAIVNAERAQAVGLVNAVFEPAKLMEESLKTARLIATKGPFAIASAKDVIARGLDGTLAAGNALEAEAFGACFDTRDQTEGMAAFLEKREPQFTGK